MLVYLSSKLNNLKSFCLNSNSICGAECLYALERFCFDLTVILRFTREQLILGKDNINHIIYSSNHMKNRYRLNNN